MITLLVYVSLLTGCLTASPIYSGCTESKMRQKFSIPSVDIGVVFKNITIVNLGPRDDTLWLSIKQTNLRPPGFVIRFQFTPRVNIFVVEYACRLYLGKLLIASGGEGLMEDNFTKNNLPYFANETVRYRGDGSSIGLYILPKGHYTAFGTASNQDRVEIGRLCARFFVD